MLKGRSNYLVLAPARRGAARRHARRGDARGAPRARRVGADERHAAISRSSRTSPTITRCARRSRRPSTTAWAGTARSSIAASSLEARRRAQAAEVVIVNHHLLLADLALKDSGFGELLPGTDAVIVDEAHQLPDVAQQFFGWSVGTRELESLARDVFAEARAAGVLAQRRRGAERARPRDRRAARRAPRGPTGRTPWIAAPAALRDALPEAAERARSARRRARAARGGERRPCAIASSAAPRARRGCARSRSPIRAKGCAGSISRPAPSRCTGRRSTSARRSRRASRRRTESGCSRPRRSPSARTSRTSCAASVCGTPLTGVLPSPFDYERNARIYLPQGLPDPSDEHYVETLLATIWPLVEAAQGGAFLLFTSYRALQRAERWLEGRAAPGPRARARPRLAQRAAESVSRRRQRDPARHRQLLAGRRRARPRAAARR